jgi:hypothetical protein
MYNIAYHVNRDSCGNVRALILLSFSQSNSRTSWAANRLATNPLNNRVNPDPDEILIFRLSNPDRALIRIGSRVGIETLATARRYIMNAAFYTTVPLLDDDLLDDGELDFDINAVAFGLDGAGIADRDL